MNKLLLMLSLLVTSCAVSSEEPVDTTASALVRDDELTPGDLCTPSDPDFDGYRYAERIAHCDRDVSRKTKVAVAAAYGIPEAALSNYQIDHLIPLSVGGSNARSNLWPLPYADARRKARFEQQLYLQISRGEITQRAAIDAVMAWR